MAKARTLTLKTKVEVTGADKLRGLGRSMQRAGAIATAGLTVPILGIGAAMLKAAEEAEKAQAKLENTFESMGAASFTTVKQLNAQAEALQNATTFDDESITEMQAVMLTFGNVTGDAFDRAIKVGADMSALLGQDLQTSAIQLGKALNDPIRGITALTRVGVSFTAQQKELIKSLAESGDLIGAQAVILGELERQFGGTAEALAETAGGKMQQALNQLNEAAEDFGAILAPALLDVAKGLKEMAKWLQSLNPETKEWVVRIALAVAALGPLLVVVGSLVRAFAALKVATGLVGAAMNSILGPIGVAVAAHLALREAQEAVAGPSIFQGWDRQWHDAAQSAEVAAIEITEAGREAIVESGKQWDKYQAAVTGAIDTSVGTVTTGVDAMADEMGLAPQKMADELLAAQFHLTDATTQLLNFMEEALSPAQEIFQLQGFLSSKALADGLGSNNPLIRLKAQEMQQAATDRIAEIRGAFFDQGYSAGATYAAGLAASIVLVKQAAVAMASATGAQIGIQSEPKDHSSPLYGITKWGGNIVKTVADGMMSNLGVMTRASTAVAGTLAIGSVGALAPAAGGAGGGVTNIYLQWDGEPPKGRNESEIIKNLQRLLPLTRGY